MFKVKDIFTWGFKAAQGIAVDLYKLSHEDIPIHYVHIKTDFDTVLKYLREVPGVESAMQATPEQIKQIMPRINYDASLVVGKVPVEEIERRYKAMGFDRAFGPGTDPQVTIACLKEDLGIA